MDFFKFNFTTDATILSGGEPINNITSSMWVERYSEPGEFSFEAQLSTGIKDFLPLGTLISHTDTMEVMIVENHEIKDTQANDPAIVITGRSFVSYLEQRIVGVNGARAGALITPYNLSAQYTWLQIVQLINDHIVSATDANDRLVNVIATSSVLGTGVESIIRTIDKGTVLEKVIELLKIDDLGIKTLRRNPFVGGDNTRTIISIYKGIDRSSSIIFSWKAGELSSADYLFSNKGYKNAALVVGQYVFVAVETGPIRYDRRTMIIDASDIDKGYGGVPTAGDQTIIANAMRTRGQQVLQSMKQITISQADISNTSRFQYRKDYNIGDLISLDGNFGQIAVMRVTEYAEIKDENGESGHPTLAIPGA